MIDHPHSGSPGNRDVFLEADYYHVCERCTACCKWPGDVRLEDEEIPRIASFLGITEHAFLEQYTRLRTNRQGLSLIEKSNHECIMLDDNSCRIHPVKPSQCAGFPNKWNFLGWRNICHATTISMAEAQARGFVSTAPRAKNSANDVGAGGGSRGSERRL